MPLAAPQGAPVYGSQRSARSDAALIDPQAVANRHPAVVVLLSLVTCGLYGVYWLYRTTAELRNATGDDRLRPGVDLLIGLLTLGLWYIFVQYRNARVIHRARSAFEPGVSDHSVLVLVLNVLALFVGVTGLVAIYVLQGDLNELAREEPERFGYR